MRYPNINKWVRLKIYEPKKRLCGGEYGWVMHRFPIKDGISWRDVMAIEAAKPNPLLKLIKVKNEFP